MNGHWTHARIPSIAVNDEIDRFDMSFRQRHRDPALSAAREGKIKVAMIGLCGCWGCTLSLLDMDERIAGALDEGHHSPVLAHRYQDDP